MSSPQHTHSFNPSNPAPQHTRVGRTESEASAQMDPEDIERFAHPQSSEVYTVVQKSPNHKIKSDDKTEEREKPVPPKKTFSKTHKSSPNLQNDSLFSFLDQSDRKIHETPSSPNLGITRKHVPPRPSAPPGGRKAVTQLGQRPLPKLPPSK